MKQLQDLFKTIDEVNKKLKIPELEIATIEEIEAFCKEAKEEGTHG